MYVTDCRARSSNNITVLPLDVEIGVRVILVDLLVPNKYLMKSFGVSKMIPLPIGLLNNSSRRCLLNKVIGCRLQNGNGRRCEVTAY